MVRFARLIQRPVRVLGGPAVRAASGGNLCLAWLPPKVVTAAHAIVFYHQGVQLSEVDGPLASYQSMNRLTDPSKSARIRWWMAR
jgi:hypothetical protein